MTPVIFDCLDELRPGHGIFVTAMAEKAGNAVGHSMGISKKSSSIWAGHAKSPATKNMGDLAKPIPEAMSKSCTWTHAMNSHGLSSGQGLLAGRTD